MYSDRESGNVERIELMDITAEEQAALDRHMALVSLMNNEPDLAAKRLYAALELHAPEAAEKVVLAVAAPSTEEVRKAVEEVAGRLQRLGVVELSYGLADGTKETVDVKPVEEKPVDGVDEGEVTP